MPRQNLNTYSGNRITAELDGAVIGLIQAVRMNDSYGLEDASGIGDIHVIEHVPSKAVHAVSVSQMVLFTGNMRQAGVAIENGEAALRGLIFDIVIYGNTQPGGGQGGTILRQIIGCSYDSGDVDVTAHRIVMSSAQFKALDVIGTDL